MSSFFWNGLCVDDYWQWNCNWTFSFWLILAPAVFLIPLAGGKSADSALRATGKPRRQTGLNILRGKYWRQFRSMCTDRQELKSHQLTAKQTDSDWQTYSTHYTPTNKQTWLTGQWSTNATPPIWWIIKSNWAVFDWWLVQWLVGSLKSLKWCISPRFWSCQRDGFTWIQEVVCTCHGGGMQLHVQIQMQTSIFKWLKNERTTATHRGWDQYDLINYNWRRNIYWLPYWLVNGWFVGHWHFVVLSQTLSN